MSKKQEIANGLKLGLKTSLITLPLLFACFFGYIGKKYLEHSDLVNFTMNTNNYVRVEEYSGGFKEVETIDTGREDVRDIKEPIASIGILDCSLIYVKGNSKHGIYHVQKTTKPEEIENWLSGNFSDLGGLEITLVQGAVDQEINQDKKKFMQKTSLKTCYKVVKDFGLDKNTKYAPYYFSRNEIETIKIGLDVERELYNGRNIFCDNGRVMLLPKNVSVKMQGE